MQTSTLIDLLVAGERQLRRPPARGRFALTLLAGGFGAIVAMLLAFGAHPTLDELLLTPAFLIRLTFVASLAVAGIGLTWRLGHPGVAASGWAWLPWAAVGAVWLLAGQTLLSVPTDARGTLLFGQTWQRCPLNITILSLPMLAAGLLALRGLAPTSIRGASAACGLLAGAAGACAYALHCPELAVPFIAIWYVLGVAVPVGLATWLGPRVLRW